MTRNRASNSKSLGRPTALQVAVDLLDFELGAPLEDEQGEQSESHLFKMGEGGPNLQAKPSTLPPGPYITEGRCRGSWCCPG